MVGGGGSGRELRVLGARGGARLMSAAAAARGDGARGRSGPSSPRSFRPLGASRSSGPSARPSSRLPRTGLRRRARRPLGPPPDPTPGAVGFRAPCALSAAGGRGARASALGGCEAPAGSSLAAGAPEAPAPSFTGVLGKGGPARGGAAEEGAGVFGEARRAAGRRGCGAPGPPGRHFLRRRRRPPAWGGAGGRRGGCAAGRPTTALWTGSARAPEPVPLRKKTRGLGFVGRS